VNLKEFENCIQCPRECKTNRAAGKFGYCKSGTGIEIASISVHKGEEPVISGEKGICNVFFSHCNLQCVYCQNFQISNNKCGLRSRYHSIDETVNRIISILDTGIQGVGFVSPSHMIPQMKTIIKALNDSGRTPIIVYNSNGYDSVEVLKSLEDIVDVYLPDFKYSDQELSRRLSDAYNYPEFAGKAIAEMYRQKGNTIRLNDDGIAENGLIIRHLVLPGEIKNSFGVLRFIAEELSVRIRISLMSQYNPVSQTKGISTLDRKISQAEYKQVVDEMDKLGFSNGWVQDFESAEFYNPDFTQEHPFE